MTTWTPSPTQLQTRFHQLVKLWKDESHYIANTAQMSMLRSYQRIIGMGPPAVPLILEELRREPDHWFWALEAITLETPSRRTTPGISTRWFKRGSHGDSTRG